MRGAIGIEGRRKKRQAQVVVYSRALQAGVVSAGAPPPHRAHTLKGENQHHGAEIAVVEATGGGFRGGTEVFAQRARTEAGDGVRRNAHAVRVIRPAYRPSFRPEPGVERPELRPSAPAKPSRTTPGHRLQRSRLQAGTSRTPARG